MTKGTEIEFLERIGRGILQKPFPTKRGTKAEKDRGTKWAGIGT